MTFTELYMYLARSLIKIVEVQKHVPCTWRLWSMEDLRQRFFKIVPNDYNYFIVKILRELPLKILALILNFEDLSRPRSSIISSYFNIEIIQYVLDNFK